MGKFIGCVFLVWVAVAAGCSENKEASTPSEGEKPEKEQTDTGEAEEEKVVPKNAEKEKAAKGESARKTGKDVEAKTPPKRPVKGTVEKKEPIADTPKKENTKQAKREAPAKREASKEAPDEEEALKRAALLASAKPPVAPKAKAIAAEAKSKQAAAAMAPTTPRKEGNPRPEPFAKPPLPISHALSSQELKQMTGQTFKPSSLGGQVPSPQYNSLYFRTPREEKLGVVVQLWHEPALKDTRARYEAMKIGYPNAQETGNVTNYTFFSHWGNVYHMVFMDLKRRRVAAVSTEALTPNQLFTVATRVRDRLLR